MEFPGEPVQAVKKVGQVYEISGKDMLQSGFLNTIIHMSERNIADKNPKPVEWFGLFYGTICVINSESPESVKSVNRKKVNN